MNVISCQLIKNKKIAKSLRLEVSVTCYYKNNKISSKVDTIAPTAFLSFIYPFIFHWFPPYKQMLVGIHLLIYFTSVFSVLNFVIVYFRIYLYIFIYFTTVCACICVFVCIRCLPIYANAGYIIFWKYLYSVCVC